MHMGERGEQEKNSYFTLGHNFGPRESPLPMGPPTHPDTLGCTKLCRNTLCDLSHSTTYPIPAGSSCEHRTAKGCMRCSGPAPAAIDLCQDGKRLRGLALTSHPPPHPIWGGVRGMKSTRLPLACMRSRPSSPPKRQVID